MNLDGLFSIFQVHLVWMLSFPVVVESNERIDQMNDQMSE